MVLGICNNGFLKATFLLTLFSILSCTLLDRLGIPLPLTPTIGSSSQQLRSKTKPLLGGNTHQTKPRLVIHVGPAKTATTTLQTELTDFFGAQRKDDYLDSYVYAGRYYYHPNMTGNNGIIEVNRGVSALYKAASTIFNKNKHCTTCLENFQQELDKLGNTNVILSNEGFSRQWTSPQHYKTINQAIGDKWDVTIVAGYRRFFEWLPSRQFQKNRMDQGRQAPKEKWPSDGGKALEPVFPRVYRQWRRRFTYIDSVLENAQDVFDVKILNMYESSSVQSTFLCHVLTDAPVSCNKSLAQDKQQQKEMTMNSEGKFSWATLFYDVMATEAAAQGFVDTVQYNRAQVRKAIQLQQETLFNKTALDLKLICPTERRLKELLHQSLEMEQTYMPELYAKHKKEHVKGFWKKVASKSFCWVDTKSVLKQPVWRDFFKQFSKRRERF